MTTLRTLLIGLLVACLPVVAAANCTDLRAAVISDAQTGDIALVQRGLKTALRDENQLLADNRLGAYTRVRLVDFCRAFPLPAGVDLVSGTLDLAADYGALAGPVRDWMEIASAASFADRLLPSDDSAFNVSILTLLGPTTTTAQALDMQNGATDCTTLTDAELDPSAQAGQLVLNGLDPNIWPDAAGTCSQLDLPAGASGTAQILADLGALEAALPDSVNQILGPDFALWLGEDIGTRGPRLVGNTDAVVALVTEYRSENRAAAPRDFSAIYETLPASCNHGSGATVTDYISFDQAAFDSLVAPVDVNGLLTELAGQSFDNRAALSNAIVALLAGQVSDCTLDQVLVAIDHPEYFGQVHTLNAEKTANLALQDDFANNAAVIEPFVGLSSSSRGGLLSAVRGALQTATDAEINAEVEAAADVLASAAEPLAETFDTLPDGVPAFDPLPENPTIGVTLNTTSAIDATVADPEFREALTGADYQVAPNAEVLKSDARRVLEPIADAKAATIVNRAMVQLQSAVDTSWALTDTLSAAIAAAPAAQGVPDAAQTDETTKVLNELIGVEYPTTRLFDAAIAPLASSVVANDIRARAAQDVPDPDADFDTNIALPDCGCVARREDNTIVYGFLPFWLAPPATNPDVAADTAEEETTPTERLIDFGVVSRAAFYGLEYKVDRGGNLFLHNEAQWTAGRRDFVNAAHRHRAKADLAINLTGWETWSDVQISTAVQNISTITLPFERRDSSRPSTLWATFPTMLDAPQVDGVTLVINGYDGRQARQPDIEKLISLVTLLKAELATRGQTINLAFDLNFSADADNAETLARAPLFSDIETLLTGARPIVDHVLIFLERPTTDTKKILRSRMENGAFRGIDRARVLRRIIPVLPPAGHENVVQSRAANADPNSPSPGPFSQFTDDLVYFQDNFAGVGFWPTPDPFGSETDAINAIFDDLWLKPILPAFLGGFEDRADRTCTFICPNRAYFVAAMLVIFALTTLVVWRSFYSGFMDKLAFKYGVAWIGSGLVFAGLLALSICDSGARLPPLLLLAMVVAAVLLVLYYIYQGAKNGPKP